MKEDIGLLIVGHGSNLEYNSNIINKLAEEFAKKIKNVEVAFLNIQQPNISDGIKKLIDNDVKKIIVFPFFLAKGVHVLEDIPKEIGIKDGENTTKIRVDGREVDIIYTRPLEYDDRLLDIALDRIKEALS